MAPLSEFIVDRLPAQTISLISTMITFGMLNASVCYTHRHKVLFRRRLLGNFLIGLTLLVPQFVIYYLFFHPGYLSPEVDGLLLFPNPLMIFLYYLIFRYIFKLNRIQAAMTLENIMLGYFQVMLCFRAFSDLWVYINNSSYAWPESFNADLLSMLSVNILVIGSQLVYKLVVKKSNNFFDVPLEFPVGSVRKYVARSFLSVLGNYIVVVSICTLMVGRRRTSMGLTSAFLYLILAIILMFRIIESMRRQRLQLIEWRSRETDIYVTALLRANDEFRGIKHDFYNILQTYGGYIYMENLDGLRSYHDSLMKVTVHAGELVGLIESLRSRPALYALLDSKLQIASQQGIEFKVTEISPIIDVELNDLDFCRVLGNLLDNAIEAAVPSEEKRIILSGRKVSDNVVIEVVNSTQDVVDPDKVFRPDFTTKKNHSGYGLVAVRGLLRNYEGCDLKMAYKDHHVIVTLTLSAKSGSDIVR